MGAVAGDRGYVCPNCGSPFLSDERQFNLMFRTSLGPVDPIKGVIEAVKKGALEGLDDKSLRAAAEDALRELGGLPAPGDGAGHVRAVLERAAEPCP